MTHEPMTSKISKLLNVLLIRQTKRRCSRVQRPWLSIRAIVSNKLQIKSQWSAPIGRVIRGDTKTVPGLLPWNRKVASRRMEMVMSPSLKQDFKFTGADCKKQTGMSLWPKSDHHCGQWVDGESNPDILLGRQIFYHWIIYPVANCPKIVYRYLSACCRSQQQSDPRMGRNPVSWHFGWIQINLSNTVLIEAAGLICKESNSKLLFASISIGSRCMISSHYRV